mmetsp:Transcript_5754/g.15909  ORF Transcript_5754/g.15909 Transcript_5754/m.15909 type:complete len:209 (-) Transcript_5754:24-650(-)
MRTSAAADRRLFPSVGALAHLTLGFVLLLLGHRRLLGHGLVDLLVRRLTQELLGERALLLRLSLHDVPVPLQFDGLSIEAVDCRDRHHAHEVHAPDQNALARGILLEDRQRRRVVARVAVATVHEGIPGAIEAQHQHHNPHDLQDGVHGRVHQQTGDRSHHILHAPATVSRSHTLHKQQWQPNDQRHICQFQHRGRHCANSGGKAGQR